MDVAAVGEDGRVTETRTEDVPGMSISVRRLMCRVRQTAQTRSSSLLFFGAAGLLFIGKRVILSEARSLLR